VLIDEPPPSEGREDAYRSEREEDGYVWNVTRLWCWRPDVYAQFAALRATLMESSALGERDWAVLVAATASQLGDSYCALAWGTKLAKLTDAVTAARVLAGKESPGLTDRERALERWARQVVDDPNGTTAADVERLRVAGLHDREIFEATAFVALRLAFSTVNDALGAEPDRQLAEAAPPELRDAISFGRSTAREPSPA
jgi:uncharacterized peroxidase-related enzyme